MAFEPIWLWISFVAFILVMLALDLGVFHRNAHAVSLREAAIWSAVWIGLALLFNAALFLWQGPGVALEFFTAYLIEKSLSVDNIFVFVVIFSAFGVPAAYQHRVLFWGILGALVMRGMLIALGLTLLSLFEWVLYLFGAFLVFTGIRLAFRREQTVHPNRNPLVRLAQRFLPVTQDYDGPRFFLRQYGRLMATPLLLVLLLIESTDLLFALDSIPAVLAVTVDPFIVYTSNVFAILGLRALYFLLAGSVQRFRYLNRGLAAILAFVGAKMLLHDLVHMPIGFSLSGIAAILLVTIAASLYGERRARQHGARGDQQEPLQRKKEQAHV
jgi:tellurite resistance protein TerC